MTDLHVVGVDPGLRDTGVVRMEFYPDIKLVSVTTLVVDGSALKTEPLIISDWLKHQSLTWPNIFIEKYVPRPGMATSPQMTELENLLARSLPGASFVRNTGVKQVIPQELMQLLKVWLFNTPTNHDDLRAAARIGLYGMAKDPAMNGILADVVQSVFDAAPWIVDVKKGEVHGAVSP